MAQNTQMAAPPLKPRRQRKELVPFYPTDQQRKAKHRLQAQFLPSAERIQAGISHSPATQTSSFAGVVPLPPPPLEQIYFTGSISKLIASKDEKEDAFAVNQLGSHLAEETLDENHLAEKACVL